MSKNLKLSMILIILVTTLITTGFTFFNRTPKTVYRVYLKGESLGLIESKKELEEYESCNYQSHDCSCYSYYLSFHDCVLYNCMVSSFILLLGFALLYSTSYTMSAIGIYTLCLSFMCLMHSAAK